VIMHFPWPAACPDGRAIRRLPPGWADFCGWFPIGCLPRARAERHGAVRCGQACFLARLSDVVEIERPERHGGCLRGGGVIRGNGTLSLITRFLLCGNTTVTLRA
jgi:hypothetical protein